MADTLDILSVKEITKSFPGVVALENVSFSLKKGEIHALLGENGAGKSTLIKVLTGVDQPDTGLIELDGKPIQVRSPRHSQEIGISTVYQEINLCGNISVAENIMLGHEPRRFGSINWKKMNILARQAMERLDIEIDVTQPLGNFSIAVQQMVSIARSLEVTTAKILILDEPTSSLDVNETNQLFDVMHKLKRQGMGIIFVTHFLDQVYEVTDRITVLRNGKLVGTYQTDSLPQLELIAKIIGRSLVDYEDMKKNKLESRRHIKGDALVTANKLGLKGSIQPFDLELHPGEVVGLAGLLGSGRTEIARLLFGIDKADNGSMTVNGKAVSDHSPQQSIAHGIALCPEDRKAEGIVGDLSIRENIILAMQANMGWFKYLTLSKQYELAEKYIKLLKIATPSADQLVKNLSGGNQQKVILARWLVTNPKLLILDEPTRGIDVGTKAEIQRLVLELAEEGKACLFISSELDEVLRTSHRIVVLRDREKVTEFAGEVAANKIMQAMAGIL